MSDKRDTRFRDEWGDFRDWVVVVFIAIVVLLVLCAIAGIAMGITYAVQGCFVNKGHIGPHISDGCYEVEMVQLRYPKTEYPTLYIKGRINGRVYGLRVDESIGEQAFSIGEGGYMTMWVKNNHIIKYHVGRKKPNEPR